MEGVYVDLLALRIVFSVLGVVGNTLLIVSILHCGRFRSFEILLLGLAAANLEEIVIVDVYDILLLRSTFRLSVWSCRGLKFLTILGEICSILFTVLISIYRYQKLRDVGTRLNLPILLDHRRSAALLALACLLLGVLFGAPTFLVKLDWGEMNSTASACPADFFQCSTSRCPARNRIYKFSFILVCNLLPLLLVTLTSCMILRVLLAQQKAVRAREAPGVATVSGQQRHHKRTAFQRGTVSVLAAMMLFQLNWAVYLLLHLTSSPYSVPSWSEVEFFISTFYTALSPYVYGLGNNLFVCSRRVC